MFGVTSVSFYDKNKTDNTPDSKGSRRSDSGEVRASKYNLDDWAPAPVSSPKSDGYSAPKYNLDDWSEPRKQTPKDESGSTDGDFYGKKSKNKRDFHGGYVPKAKAKPKSGKRRPIHTVDDLSEDERESKPKRAPIENLNVTEKKRAQGIPTRADTQWNEEEQSPEKIYEFTARQRKMRSTLTYIGLFFVIVLVAVIFSVTIIFKTDNIIVEGDTIYSSEEIIDASGLYYGENIFLSPKKAAAKSIVDEYPYIETAEISFKIPGTQIITVTAAIPSYEVSVDDGYIVVSSSGRILEYNEEATDSIPTVKGVTVTETEVGEYITYEKSSTQQIISEVIDAINENSVSGIYGIDISNAANIKLNYDNRITILLGLPEDVSYKLRTAMTIIEDELVSTDKGELDVSLSNSDRKSSYYTPYYSNTVSMDSSSAADSDTDSAAEVESADETETSTESGA